MDGAQWAYLELVVQLGIVGGGSDILLPRLDLGAGVDGLVVGGDDGAGAHQGAVGLEGGQLGLGVGDLGLEGIDLGLVVVELGGQLGVVGGELGLAGQLGDLGTLGLDTGGAVLAALGRDGGGEDERDENVGQLHFGGIIERWDEPGKWIEKCKMKVKIKTSLLLLCIRKVGPATKNKKNKVQRMKRSSTRGRSCLTDEVGDEDEDRRRKWHHGGSAGRVLYYMLPR